MRYGYFYKNKYIIFNPKTPKPWMNYLGTDNYCAITDNNAGGYSFYKSPKTGRILRYRFNNIPMSRPGRYIYIKDLSDNEYWSVSWEPVAKDLNKFKTKTIHGQGYTVIESVYKDILARVTYYVPVKGKREIWFLELENLSEKDRLLDIFSYAEFALWYSFLDMLDLQYILFTGRMSFKNDYIGYFHREAGGSDKYAYFTSTETVKDFDTDRDIFIGGNRSESNPVAVEEGKCSGSLLEGGNPCAGLRHTILLKKHKKKKITFILGIGKVDRVQKRLKEKYRKHFAQDEIEQVKLYWQGLLNKFSVNTPDEEIDVMANYWNQYQCHTTFKWSRSASFIEAGGRDGLGFRDSAQDVLGVMHSVPEKAKLRIMELLKAQASDGCAFHHFQPLTMAIGKGEKPKIVYSDDHLWIIPAISAYLKETGDFSFIKTVVQFCDKGRASVLEHMKKAIDYSFNNTGNHKLCLGLYADWNDCINLKGKGESVWTTLLLYKVLGEFLDILKLTKRKNIYKLYNSKRNKLKNILNKYGWNGKWFVRAYLDDGAVIGSFANREGKIYINTQSWGIYSGLADKNQSKSIIKNVLKYLDTKYGLLLVNPSYRNYNSGIGAITSFPKGLKENGSIFCHTNPWFVMAEAMAGNGDLAYRHFKNILPSHYNERTDKYTEAPYVYSQFITGVENKKFGRAENPWLTGTAAWGFVALTQYILGIKPGYNGLVIDPCIPKEWKEFKVNRIFRSVMYNIHVRNPNSVNKGIKQVKINGKISQSNTLPILKKGTKNNIEIIMG